MSVTTRHAAQRARAVAPRTPVGAGRVPRAGRAPVRPATGVPRSRGALSSPTRVRPHTRPQREREVRQARPKAKRPTAVQRKGRARGAEWSTGTFQRRVRLLKVALVVALIAMMARLVDIQVFHSSAYAAQGRGESSIQVALPSLRGGIYDRDGAPLALSVATDDVVADDYQVKQPVQLAQALSPLLHVPAVTLAAELHKPSGYVVLAKQLPQSTGQKITTDAFPGVTLVADAKREVTDGNLASSVIGFTHGNGVGAAGLEYGENAKLAGTAGKETILESPSGITLPQSPVTDKVAATAGTGIELSIDSQLQYESEQALAKAIESSNSLSGTAIVEDVKTGQILSMANLTATHPAALGATASTTGAAAQSAGVVPIGPKDPVNEAANNLAVTQLYEPGSVFKLVTFSAALNDGIINPNTVFSVPDQIQLDGSTFHDAEPHPTEALTATQILAQSSNIGTSEIAQGLGEQRLLAQVQALGFGQPTGLSFPGEEQGLLATAAQWEPTDYVSLPIGQVDAVSALQVLDAYNAVANGGVFVQPKLIDGTVGANGTTTPTKASSTHRVISTAVDSQLINMLEQVVAQGTGTSAVVPGYAVAGKTGTAQIPTAGHDSYIPGAYMASFVGFAPAQNPTISMIVVLDRPTPIFGGTVAAPVFSQIMSYALHRYDIPTSPGAATSTPPTGSSTTTSDQTQDIT